MRVNFCKIPIINQDTNFFSQTSISTRKRKEILWKKYCFDSACQQRKALSQIFLSQHLMQVITCRGQHSSAGLTTSLSTDSKTYALLTSVQNNADTTDAADDTNNYNRVIGMTQLKAFSGANKLHTPHTNKCMLYDITDVSS